MSRSFSVFLLPTQSFNYWYLLLTLIDIGQNIWKFQKQKGSGLGLGGSIFRCQALAAQAGFWFKFTAIYTFDTFFEKEV